MQQNEVDQVEQLETDGEELQEQGSVSDATQSGPLGRAFDNGFGYRA
jgi:hypothetical protein